MHGWNRFWIALIAGLMVAVHFLACNSPAAEPSAVPAAKADARDCWMKQPTVSIMTGFIYDPRGMPYSIQKWMVNLGDKFNAEQWAKDFKETGATHVVVYDNWVDGLVFHDTRTTNFKTKKDFVR
jgi:hypothetical protein